jgi:hypothetical protein
MESTKEEAITFGQKKLKGLEKKRKKLYQKWLNTVP